MSKTKKTTVNVNAAAAPVAAANTAPPMPPPATTVPPLPAALQNPGAVTLPLPPATAAAYQDLYNQYETAIEATPVGDLKTSLQASQDAVGEVLEQNAEGNLLQGTPAYQTLLTQIATTNAGLKTLQGQLAKISGTVQTVGTVLNAINKVLGLVGV